ncbi:MAG TPA: hypothetical protein ENF18_01120 [candidate division WOR-3 bacterium]|uniref:Uncharacterized protein n=1 Tax=candidate division WOR-3 bacterium TaxID=2052148 RepID=A0A7C0V9L4_UNCW3|nr:hypothetical protein [candidate division WOR-3 bacterium]
MIYLMIFLGVFNIEEHPRYEEVKKMFVDAVERHPEVKIGKGACVFEYYFIKGALFIRAVWEEMLEGIDGGRYKHIWDILLDKTKASPEARALFVVSTLGGSDIVMGEIVKVFPDSVRVCRKLDKNYLLRVDRVFQGRIKVGDTIQIKFFGNVLSFSPSGPHYRFMGGDTIIASLYRTVPECLKDDEEVGYTLPFYIPAGDMYRVTGLRVRIEGDSIVKERVPIHIKGEKFNVPLDVGIEVLERMISIRERYFNMLYDRMTPELMDSFFVYLRRNNEKTGWVYNSCAEDDEWFIGLLKKWGER